ncbi:MAG TPA: T9SS type A sorting domain-containing protein [bacterium]|nr:T9SS type A sorting domain-containing protein [bacterium]
MCIRDRPYTYQWSTGATTVVISNLPQGSYSCTVTDNNGCTASDSAFFNDLVWTPVPICLVTVDSTSTKNVVVWEKPVTVGIDSFRVYREIGLNNYVHIGSIEYLSLSEYTDTSSGINPMVQSYRYKLSVIDTCGNESALSSHHRTIHLSPPQYTPPSTYSLIWTNDYEGYFISGYNILRDSYNTNTWNSIGFVTFGNLSFTDINAPSGNARYRIEAAHPTGCTTTKKGEYNSSISNSSTTLSVGVEQLQGAGYGLRVYPNPGRGVFTLSTNYEFNTNVRILVYDVLGREVYKSQAPSSKPQVQSSKIEIDLSGQTAGVYHLQVIMDKGLVNRKIIIQ